LPALLLNPLVVFSTTLFLSAFLLFWVELMIGKMILPTFGGTPAVWNTCMFFFQIVLFVGYCYSHLNTSKLRLRWQLLLHGTLLVAAPLWFVFAPLGIYRGFEPPAHGYPALWVLALLTLLIGLPFFVISTSAPLLQRWFGHTGHPAAKDPYFLYAASNLGSLLGLNGYILVIEPVLTLKMQGIVWMVCFAMLMALTGLCAYHVRWGAPKALLEPEPEPAPRPAPADGIQAAPSEQIAERPTEGDAERSGATDPDEGEGEGDEAAGSEAGSEGITSKPMPVALKGTKRWRKQRDKGSAEAITKSPAAKRLPMKSAALTVPQLDTPPTLLQQIHWVLLGFVPSSLLLGVTTFVTTDLAPIPLLWTIPLDLYLITFILVFSRLPTWVHQSMVLSLPVAALLLVFMNVAEGISIWMGWRVVLNLVALFIVAMVCHGELAAKRPAIQYLTKFFLLMSLGGLLGGMFNSLVAPVTFISVAEYPLLLVLACMMLPALEMDAKSPINRWVDNGLAIGLTAAASYTVFKWAMQLRTIQQLTEAQGDVFPWTEYWKQYLVLPGVPDGTLPLVFLIAGLVLVLLYVGLPRTNRLARLVEKSPERRGPLWFLNRFVMARKTTWLERLQDVELPLCLLLLTIYLKTQQPFASWNFAWLARFFNTDEERIVTIFTYGLPVALCYGFAEQPIRFGLGVGAILFACAFADDQRHVVLQDRGFFGVVKVEKAGPFYRLLHGTTLHGMQLEGSNEALTYYHRTGPIGQAYQAMFSGEHSKDPVAFVGLGTGTMASYLNPGQKGTFYEIDQKVIDIAENPQYFTYLSDSKARGADYKFDIGDARLRLKYAPDNHYRLIVVDAFSSDAIPVHLITKEALELYFQKLTEDGIACIHISNRYLRLGPVLGNIAKELGFAGIHEYDGEHDLGGARFPGKNSSDWVVIARKPKYLEPLKMFDKLTSMNASAYKLEAIAGMVQPFHVPILAGNGRWEPLEDNPDVGIWTDDYSNIFKIFRWKD